MQRDQLIFDLIEKEKKRQKKGIELIASENFTSSQVMEAMGSVLTNKYAEGLPGKRYYGGCEVVDEVETLAIERIKELFGAEWANVQPHSGAQANAGDTILGFNLAHGGHLTHGSSVNFSGKLYRPVFYGVEESTGLINWDQVAEIARKEKPKLIIAGASAYSRDWNYEKLREAAEECGALLMADIAHPAGLIARGLLNDPLDYCHIVTSTTHKTLRGPRGGLIMARENIDNPMGLKTSKGLIRKLTSVLDSGVFPGTQGGPLEHVIAAKAVAFKEALSDDYLDYVIQVQKNARAMAQKFIEKSYEIISGGTDNHMMLIDLRSKNITGKEAEDALIRADITINKNMVPFDDKSPFVTSGMRVGTSAMTSRGFKEAQMEKIVDLIDRVLENRSEETVINEVKHEVNEWMAGYQIFQNNMQ